MHGCRKRGSNHIIASDGATVGKYCDDCFRKVHKYYSYAEIRKYPRTKNKVTIRYFPFRLVAELSIDTIIAEDKAGNRQLSESIII